MCNQASAPVEDQHETFMSALAALACGGRRRCITSVLMRETEMKALTGNHPRKYAPGVRVDAFDELDTVDDAGLDSSFMCSDPVAEDLAAKVGAVDRSLVAVLDQIAADDAPNDDFEGVALVTNDEALFGWVQTLASVGLIGVLAITSVDLILEMSRCGAMDVDQAGLALEAEENEYDAYENPPTADVLAQKLRRLRRVATQLAGLGTLPRRRP